MSYPYLVACAPEPMNGNSRTRIHRLGPLLAAAFMAIAAGTAAARERPAAPGRSSAARKLAPALRAQMAEAGARGIVLAWVRFADKGRHEAAKLAPPSTLVSPRSLQRRAKVLSGALVDSADLPVDGAYVQRVASLVRRVRHRSRWFNAVSVEATPAQLEAVAALGCVRAIEPLLRYRRSGSGLRLSPVPEPGSGSPSSRPGAPAAIDYGLSFPQLQLLQVPALHSQGITGQGVLIAHFDDGYARLDLSVFGQLQIEARYDFVDHDPDPTARLGAFGGHGVATLSVLAGYAPGSLVGAAFGAHVALARTEDDGSETPLEEDNWAAAAEWADSLGADIITSSLGYLDYQEPFPSWSWEDMDGNTTIITRAADMAVSRGIIVVNAAGNQGSNLFHNTLLAPADGDSVITVGGVHAQDGSLYPSSSVGPTTSDPPRLKPDVMAPGTAVYVAGTNNDYGYSAGTSFSAPLAAGVCALLLSARPQSTPMQVLDALRVTASRASVPDNVWGWGIVNAVAALEQLRTPVRPASWTALKGAYR